MTEFAVASNCRIANRVLVPMRDGVRLATTIFLPCEGDGPFPIVLVRNAYNRHGVRPDAFVAAGIGLVVQDVRGRYDSEGEFYPFVNEGEDGVDCLRWLHDQPWCNGRIGMFGASYLAGTQLYLAPEAGDLLTALNPQFMTGDPWRRAYYCDGIFSLALTWSWLCLEVANRVSDASFMPLLDVAETVRHLPLVDFDVATTGSRVQSYRDYVEHCTYDAHWERVNVYPRLAEFAAPCLLTAGWYDYYPGEQTRLFNGLREVAPTPELAAQHRLLIGPWTHGIHGDPVLGDVDFGPDAVAEDGSTARWLNALLKGRPAASVLPKPVRVFTMGANRWEDFDAWPPPETSTLNWYLHSEGHANTRDGDGLLSLDPPAEEPADRYDYDPADPVLTLGGNHSVGRYNPGLYEIALPGPIDQARTEQRPDVLVYTSAPLAADLQVTGDLELILLAATSAPDTDFAGRLVDVDPDGRAINIAEGGLRARFRNGVHAPPELLEPGGDYEYSIDLGPTSHVFLAGHRLRLQVTSSNFPLWDRNLNTGGNPATGTEWQVAHQTIHHDDARPSRLRLPVLTTTRG